MGTMDSFKERAKRSVMGRRGCRGTASVEDRYAILGFVIWHNDADYVCDELLIAEGEKPGIIASYIYQKFRREFEREDEERRGSSFGDSNLVYRHQFDALGGKAATSVLPDGGNGRLRLLSQRLVELTPPPGITFNYSPSTTQRRWRPKTGAP